MQLLTGFIHSWSSCHRSLHQGSYILTPTRTCRVRKIQSAVAFSFKPLAAWSKLLYCYVLSTSILTTIQPNAPPADYCLGRLLCAHRSRAVDHCRIYWEAGVHPHSRRRGEMDFLMLKANIFGQICSNILTTASLCCLLPISLFITVSTARTKSTR